MFLYPKIFNLNVVYSNKILEAEIKETVFLPGELYESQNPLYYCSRQICKKEVGNSFVYMDILLYNSYKKIIGKEVVNRSLGHVNDTNEIEIHQVLNGKVLCYINYCNKIYLGIFKAGEYFEIPKGAYHCTYILENKTIVANIYANIFWEKDYSLKPYFNFVNDIAVIYKDKLYLSTRDGKKIEIDNNVVRNINKYGFFNYQELNENDLTISRSNRLDKSIFDLLENLRLG